MNKKNKIILVYPIPNTNIDVKKKLLKTFNLKKKLDKNEYLITTDYMNYLKVNNDVYKLLDEIKNPNLYTSVSAFSPICSPINCPWGIKALSNYIGGNSKDNFEEWAKHDAVELVKQSSESIKNSLPVLIDQGDADNFLKEQLKTQLLIDASKKEEFPMNIRYQEGYDHSYFFIASFIQDHIAFHSKYLNEENLL